MIAIHSNSTELIMKNVKRTFSGVYNLSLVNKHGKDEVKGIIYIHRNCVC